MNFRLSTWIGEVTTGHGAMILGPTLLAASSGTMAWSTAVPFLAAGVVGLLWPENVALKSATQTTVTNIETLVEAYRTGTNNDTTVDASDAAVPPSASRAPGGTVVSALALLVAAGLTLGACANQTPAQQAATQTTIASGILCLADASGQVIETVATNDSNAMKSVNAAITAGSALLTDSACQAALASAAMAAPATATVGP